MKNKILALLAVAAAGSFAAAQTSIVGATVTTNNLLALTAGSNLSLTLGTADSTTKLDYTTNDGATRSISVSADAGGWAFTPAASNSSANGYPTLAVSAMADTNPNLTTIGSLISAGNIPATAFSIVSGIANEAGTATVSLLADGSTVSLTAGSYSTTLNYTFQ